MASTFRHDVPVNLLLNVLNVYKAANPTLLRFTSRSQPNTIGEVPAAWIGNRHEDLTHDAGTRGRTMLVELVVADDISDLVETTDRVDPLIDALIDALTATPYAVGTNVVLDPVGIDDGEITQGVRADGTPMRRFFTSTITVRVRILEGRA